MSEPTLCACGAEISRFSTTCQPCRVKRIISAAEIVAPSGPLNLIDSDIFLQDLDDASDEHPGEWAHPCDEEPLKVNAKRMAAELAERVVEEMCEEAFEDAEGHVKGGAELERAFEAALTAFNQAQTACSWTPNTKQVFLIPAGQPS